jgi:alanine dehydrogenase
MKTLVITKKQVSDILTPRVTNRTVEKAFRAYGLGQADMPPKSYLYFKKGDLRAMPAYLHGQGFNIAGVKSVNVHPGNDRFGLPTVMAVIVLVDPKTGFPLALLDGTHLTMMRTGGAGAVAIKVLSRKTSRVAGFVGSGIQARTQLACAMEVRGIKAIKVWQRNKSSTSAPEFCGWAEKTFGLQASISREIDDVTTGVDILFTTTPSRKPIVTRVSPGTHINAIGADAPGKQEISPQILKTAKIVVDDWRQASHSGEINVPLGRRQLRRKDLHGELGAIVAGIKAGRATEDEITLFDSTGLAIQDMACASVVYREIKARGGGREIDLF